MRAGLSFAIAGLVSAWHEGTTSADLRRAFKKRPHKNSHVAGDSPEEVFAVMNKHLVRSGPKTRPCESWDHDALNALLRRLDGERDLALHEIYKGRSDKRALHFDAFGYKEALWREEKAAHELGSLGSLGYNHTRDGKCAELVMWWVHHLPHQRRLSLSEESDFEIPLMPKDGPAMQHVEEGKVHKEYVEQIQCISCHLTMPCRRYSDNNTAPISLMMFCPEENATMPPADEPKVNYHATGQPQQCPNNPETGKPWVYYDRKKRCEWDFDPPCGMCEGIGGPIWGDGEDEWRATRCTPLLKPEWIPKHNLTTPVWPKAFTTTEYSCGNGNALDACSPKTYNCANNSHGGWELTYRQRDMSEYPTAENWPLSGLQPEQHQYIPDGASGMPSQQWTMPNGNMYMSAMGFCMCFSDPNKQPRGPDDADQPPGGKFSPGTPNPFDKADNVLLGPLRWDFPHDAILIGRELIELEWTSYGLEDSRKMVVADHYNKGPHHFWYEVSTNMMVRQYQTEAALTIQTNWKIGEPDPKIFELDATCSNTSSTVNMSCVAPLPSPPPPTLV